MSNKNIAIKVENIIKIEEERNKTLRYMRVYFDLCSEEYFLWKSKHIDEKT